MNPETAIMQFLSSLALAVPKLFELWSQDRDAFLKALDATLEASRKAADTDLARKHEGKP